MPRTSLIKLRSGTTAQWAAADTASATDPARLLAAGEPGRDTTTGVLKVGDGATAFADLPGYLDERGLARELATSTAARPDLADQLAAPLWIGHRGGRQVHGEHSREAYAWCAAHGYAIELDLHPLADGGVACVHDATTARTMVDLRGGPAVDVSTITSVSWKRDWRVLPRLPGGDLEQPMLLEDALDLYGGRVLVVPEVKDSAVRERLLDAIAERRLERAVVVQSFSLDDVTAAAARGVRAMRLGGSEPAADLAARGIEWVGLDASVVTDARVAELRAAGIATVAYTVNRRDQAEALLGRGVHGVFSDDPAWVSGRRPVSYADPFTSRVPWPHLVATDNAGTPTGSGVWFRDGGLAVVQPATSTIARSVSQDWCPPVGSGLARIDLEVDFLPTSVGDATRFAGIALGRLPAEGTYVDGSGVDQDALHLLVRRDGRLQVYTNTGGTGAALRATTNGTTTAPLDRRRTLRLRLVRDAAAVTLTNVDNGEAVSLTDTAATWPGSRLALTANGTSVVFRHVTVTPLSSAGAPVVGLVAASTTVPEDPPGYRVDRDGSRWRWTDLASGASRSSYGSREGAVEAAERR